jgi:hypothetical protein
VRAELQRQLAELYREKSLLQGPAYLWERYASAHCEGSCASPIVVAVDVSGTYQILCCEIQIAHRMHAAVMREEALLRARLKITPHTGRQHETTGAGDDDDAGGVRDAAPVRRQLRA